MDKLALLMSTDDWAKVEVHRDFLSRHHTTVWRSQRQYSERWLSQFTFPIHLYFFHRNEIRYQAIVAAITHGNRWTLDDIPPEFRSNPTHYCLFITIKQIIPIGPVHVWDFPKWANPTQHFTNGQFGLLCIVDIFPERQNNS